MASQSDQREVMVERAYVDQILHCKKCEAPFTWTANDQKFFERMKFDPPKRCAKCKAHEREIKSMDSDSSDWRAEALHSLKEARDCLSRVDEILERMNDLRK